MPAPVDIGTLIERSPDLKRNRPRIAGTGVMVMRIAVWSNMGNSPEEIAAMYPHISLAGVHAALAYYHANREEIDADLAEEDAICEQLEREQPVNR